MQEKNLAFVNTTRFSVYPVTPFTVISKNSQSNHEVPQC